MDLDLDFDHLYHRPSQSQPHRTGKSMGKKKKKRTVKRRRKKKVPKEWDDSLSNLKEHKLSAAKQMEKKLGVVSKHRHYAKDLIQEQKRKHSEQRRLAAEEREFENEQKQLIRRKQALLRKHAVPNISLKRAFPTFTIADNDSDSEQTSQFEESDSDDYGENICPNRAVTLQALSSKLSSLENELETMKLSKSIDGMDTEDKSDQTGNVKLNMERINQTINEAKGKKSAKTLDVKLPQMPNIISDLFSNTNNNSTNEIPKTEQKTINTALNSLDVPSLMMLLNKLKVYFKEIQNEKKQNEEFRSNLLESVNAQNTQILHLLAQLASQRKEIDTLKSSVCSLTDKLDKFENANESIQRNNSNSEAKWIQYMPNSEIGLKDIKNLIEESRPKTKNYKTQTILQNTDWKSISDVLPPKNDCFEYKPMSQQIFSVAAHQRSFLPSRPNTAPSSQEQRQRINPPQPTPKEKGNKSAQFIQSNVDKLKCHYPRVIVERFNK